MTRIEAMEWPVFIGLCLFAVILLLAWAYCIVRELEDPFPFLDMKEEEEDEHLEYKCMKAQFDGEPECKIGCPKCRNLAATLKNQS